MVGDTSIAETSSASPTLGFHSGLVYLSTCSEND
ncbi:Uncharacterised protein [Vibrio cholerae]|nr:Uncharacterised protein [Vibrio cholerae]